MDYNDKEAIRLFRTLNRVGIVDNEIVTMLKLDEEHLKQAIKEKLIRKDKDYDKESRKEVEFYRITKKGLRFQDKFLKSQYPTIQIQMKNSSGEMQMVSTNNQHYGFQSYEHDIKLARYYTYNLTEQERDTLINESEMRDMYEKLHPERERDHTRPVSTVDFAYQREGAVGVTLVESITGNYTDVELQEKENFAEDVGANIDYV